MNKHINQTRVDDQIASFWRGTPSQQQATPINTAPDAPEPQKVILG